MEGKAGRPHRESVRLSDRYISNEPLKIPRGVSVAATARRLCKPDVVLRTKHERNCHPVADSVIPGVDVFVGRLIPNQCQRKIGINIKRNVIIR